MGPQIGQPAPSIEIGEWISAKPRDVISGKNVVIEFWGTHCGPCITAIRHLNELAAIYANNNTLFISLSQDEPDVVKRFLEKRPIIGAVALDQNGATFEAYAIKSIPHTFLIDTQGILRWHGHPNLFNAQLLSTFLETDQVPEITKPSTATETVPATTPDTLFYLKIDRGSSERKGSGSSSGKDQFKMEFSGSTVVDIICSLLDYPQTRLRLKGEVPTDLLDLELQGFHPLKAEPTKKRAVEVLCDMFAIEVSTLVEPKQSWALSYSHPKLADMSEFGSACR